MLRRNPSRLETEAWAWLRTLRDEGIAVRRQHPIGRYIADFAIMRSRVAIEIDGPLHEERRDEDKQRDDAFAVLGWRVIRFTAEDLNDSVRFLARVRAAASPSPRGEGVGGEAKHRPPSANTQDHPIPQPPPLTGRGSATEFPRELQRRTRANRKLPPRRQP
jgi:very-short-patch-repair endonuclease